MDTDSTEYLKETLEKAIAAGICRRPHVEMRPILEPFAHLDPKVRKLLEETRPATQIPKTLQYNDPARDTVSQKYQEALYRLWDPGTFNLPPNQAIEVARFRARIGEVGVVKGIWTHAEYEFELPPPPAPLFPPGTGSAMFDPLAMLRAGIRIVYHLRLQQREPNIERPWWAGFWAGIPGTAFQELPYWADQRFGWGVGEGGVFWLVPGGFDLKLIVQGVTNSDLVTGLLCRMWGYTQPHMRLDTRHNMRHGWQW